MLKCSCNVITAGNPSVVVLVNIFKHVVLCSLSCVWSHLTQMWKFEVYSLFFFTFVRRCWLSSFRYYLQKKCRNALLFFRKSVYTSTGVILWVNVAKMMFLRIKTELSKHFTNNKAHKHKLTGEKWQIWCFFWIEIYTRPLITREYNWEKCAVFFTKWTDDHTEEIVMFLTVIQCSDIKR